MVVELANEEVAVFEAGPAEHGVGLDLHGALAVGGALAVVGRVGGVLEVGRPGGAGLLFDLEKKRFCRAGAFEVDAVIAQADGAGADDFEGDGEWAELREKVAMLRQEALGVLGERGENLLLLLTLDGPEHGRFGTKLPAVGGLLHEAIEGDKWGGTLGFEEDFGDGRDCAETVYLVTGDVQDGHAGEAGHHACVAVDEELGGVGGVLRFCGDAGQDDARGHTPDVPVEGPLDSQHALGRQEQ